MRIAMAGLNSERCSRVLSVHVEKERPDIVLCRVSLPMTVAVGNVVILGLKLMISEPFACSSAHEGMRASTEPKNLERQGRHFRHDRDNSAGGCADTRREQNRKQQNTTNFAFFLLAIAIR